MAATAIGATGGSQPVSTQSPALATHHGQAVTGRTMKLEFRICISPKPEFYSTVRLAAMSLRKLGPPYDSARILVSVGDYADLESIRSANRWSEAFPVQWRTVSHEKFREFSSLATDHDRFIEPSDADVVIMCDSDLCPVERIDDLIGRIGESGRFAIAGLQAHFTPFHKDAAGNEVAWRRIFAAAGLGEPRLSVQYSNDTADVMGRAPPYFNFGFVLFRREAFAAIAPIYESYVRITREATEPGFFFQTQIGLSLAIAAAKVDIELLSHAYNCANDDGPFAAPEAFRLKSPDEISVIHYLRKNEMDRRSFLANRSFYKAFLAAPNLNRVNARLRDHVLELGKLCW